MQHYQRGSVTKQGAKGNQVWVGRWRGDVQPDGKRKRHKTVLGFCSEIDKREAKDKLEGQLRAAGNKPVESAFLTFGDFWKNRYVPKRKAGWSEPTEHGYNNYYGLFFAGKFENVRVTDMTTEVLDTFFATLKDEGYSRSVINKVWAMLKAVLEYAVDKDVLIKNPMKKVTRPVIPKPKRPTLPPEELPRILERSAKVGPMVNAIMHTGIFCAMRTSEVFALKWESLVDDVLVISDVAWHGKIFADTTKTEDSARAVAVPPGTLAAILAWKKVAKFTAPGNLIFCNKKGGAISAHNFRNRVLAPMREELKIAVPLSFQVMRRSHATRNQARPKDLQSHLGHGSIVMTLGTYAQAVTASVREMVTTDEASVLGTLGLVNGSGLRLAPRPKRKRRVTR